MATVRIDALIDGVLIVNQMRATLLHYTIDIGRIAGSLDRWITVDRSIIRSIALAVVQRQLVTTLTFAFVRILSDGLLTFVAIGQLDHL